MFPNGIQKAKIIHFDSFLEYAARRVCMRKSRVWNEWEVGSGVGSKRRGGEGDGWKGRVKGVKLNKRPQESLVSRYLETSKV